MSDDHIAQLAALGGLDEAYIEDEIVRILTAVGNEAMSVKAARDHFSGVLARARQGGMQLIGLDTADMAVVLSVKDLAALIASSDARRSFGSALDEIGFLPLGRRIRVAQGDRADPPLRRRKSTRTAEG